MTTDRANPLIDPRLALYEGENAPRKPVSIPASAIARAIKSHASPNPRILVDLGCGNGELGTAVRGLLPDLVHVGLDWAGAQLREATANGVVPVRGALDPAQVPIADATCDVVLLSEVIEHLVDTDRVLAEAYRILKPDGVFIVTTPNLGAWFNRIMLLGGRQPVFSEVSTRRIYGRGGSIVAGHLRLFTTRALTEMLADNGFTDHQVIGVTYHDVPKSARWLDKLIARWSTSAAALLVVVCHPDPT